MLPAVLPLKTMELHHPTGSTCIAWAATLAGPALAVQTTLENLVAECMQHHLSVIGIRGQYHPPPPLYWATNHKLSHSWHFITIPFTNFNFATRCYASARPMPPCGVCLCVCPSVRLSVTFVDCVKTNKHIFKVFSPSGSQVVSGGVCWWRETTTKCLWQEASTLRQRQWNSI